MTRFKPKLEELLPILQKELDRNFKGLRMPYYKDLSPHYMSYSFVRSDELEVEADVGSVECRRNEHGLIGTEIRVGQKDLPMFGGDYTLSGFYANPDERSLEVALWLMTDGAFKLAASDYLDRKKGKLFLSAKKRSKRLMFSGSKGYKHHEEELDIGIDPEEWAGNLADATAIMRDHGCLTDSGIELNAMNTAQCFINSEGSEIFTNKRFYQIDFTAESVTRHKNRKFRGDTVGVYRTLHFKDPADLPSRDELIEMTRQNLSVLDELLVAPVQEPVDRPAIFDPEFSAQLIYTIMASDMLNSCCFSSMSELRLPETGDKILPDFISVKDRPGEEIFTENSGRSVRLSGHRKYDQQGVPSRSIDLIVDGKVTGFPCTREYIKDMQKPNGHARYGGDNVVPMITNMFVKSKKTDSIDGLKDKLLEMCDEKGHDYGFFVTGVTEARVEDDENFYMLTPRLTYRVWAKDAHDEDSGRDFKRGDLQLVRGVQIVGNPDTTMSNMLCTGDDYSVTVPHEAYGVRRFHQGRDSSVICPSTIISRVEIKREFYPKTRPPLMPHPFYDKKSGDGTDGGEGEK